ncbi:MAG: thiamine pyrophosphate-binding protein [Chloroflexi bacterium]|nr:thiamine pyrophosphate-binding protein [Chloroflexota bacterium]
MEIHARTAMTGSSVLAETLRGYGVTHVFLVPAILTPALAQMDEMGITTVAGHSELAAAYMADGFARAASRPAVCMAQAVGAANMAAGLREPFLASSPVIAITGGPHPDSRYRHLYQQIEDFPMYGPVTKFNARVDKVERLPDLLRQAFRAATTGAPGPVHLEVPGRLGQGIFGECDVELVIEEQFGKYPVYRPEPEIHHIREAAALLSRAERPVIVAGGGVIASDAAGELVKLAEMLSIPVATSLNGKGTIPENHPLSLGVIGTYGRWGANQAVTEADLVFFAGTRAGGHVTNDWTVPHPGTTIIHMDIDPAEIGRNYPTKVGLLGDARATLGRLIDAAQAGPPRTAWVQRTQELVGQWRASVAPLFESDAVPIRPERICKEIAGFLPADGVLVADTGHSAIWSGTMVELRQPGQRYIRCAGTLGWGFPGSLGVKCALPDRPVLCFTGDGGFYYHLSELETAARLGINIVVLVNNNGGWNQTARGVRSAYGGQKDRGRNLWAFEQTQFAGLAEAMGCLGIRVTEPGEIRGALERAFAAKRPALIDVVTDEEAVPPGPSK